MLDVEGLKQVLMSAVSSGEFPASGAALSAAIVGYVRTNGQALSPTITYTLAPASGTAWALLIPKASERGVADYIISDAISQEFAGSTKLVPAPYGVQTLPMVFNNSAKVSDLSNFTDYEQVWREIARAIIDFLRPEII